MILFSDNQFSRKDFFLLLLLGLLFSPCNDLILKQIFHIRLNLPELMIIPIIYLARKNFVPAQFTGIQVLFTLGICAVLHYLGTIYQDYTIFAVSEAFLYLLICFFIYKNGSNFDTDIVLILSFGSLVGWLIVSFWFFYSGNFLDLLTHRVTYGNYLVIPLFLSIVFARNNYKLLLFGLLIILGIILTAALRRVILLTLASLIIIYLLSICKSLRQAISATVLIGLLVFIVSLILPHIENYIQEISPYLYMRLFERTEDSFSGYNGGDMQRISFINSLGEYIDNVFPRGYVSTATDTDYTLGRFRDFPLLMLFHTFGSIIAVFLLVIIAIRLFNLINLYLTDPCVEYSCIITVVIVMFILLFIDGSFIMNAYISPFTGACLGRLFYLTNKNDYYEI